MEKDFITRYYDSLTDKQKELAFKQMVEELEMTEYLRVANDDERQEIYWRASGTPLGERE